MRKCATTLLALVLLLAANPAAGAGPDEANHAQAQKLVIRGSTAFQKGDFAAALLNFRAAYDLYPSPKVLYDLAMCHLKLQHPTDAASTFNQYLELGAADPKLPNLETARSELERLTPSLARLNLAAPRPEVQAMLDGASVRSGATFLAPGDHTLIWTAPGSTTRTQKLNLKPGSETNLTLDLTAEGRRPLPAWEPGPAGDLALVTSAFMREHSFHDPTRLTRQVSASGAYGKANAAWERTSKGKFSIDAQWAGEALIAAGISNNRQDLVDLGRKVLDWGFAHQDADGGFEGREPYHETAAFLQGAAHAALLLEASPLRIANHAWVESVTPKLLRAAKWMTNPANEKAGVRRDRPFPQRLVADALALGEVGVLAGDPVLVTTSWSDVQDCLKAQDDSGAFLERETPDSSAQARALNGLLSYVVLIATPPQRQTLTPALNKGLAWLRAQAKPSRPEPSGAGASALAWPARLPLRAAYRAAYGWAMVSRDPQWEQLAQDLAATSGNGDD